MSEENTLEAARKEVVERLWETELALDSDSHERLAAICRAVYNPAYGWTYGACAILVERLKWLIGGEGAPESEPEAECGANGDSAEEYAIPPITQRLRDAMQYSYLVPDGLVIKRERFAELCDEIDAVNAVLEDSLRDARDEAENNVTNPFAEICAVLARLMTEEG